MAIVSQQRQMVSFLTSFCMEVYLSIAFGKSFFIDQRLQSPPNLLHAPSSANCIQTSSKRRTPRLGVTAYWSILEGKTRLQCVKASEACFLGRVHRSFWSATWSVLLSVFTSCCQNRVDSRSEELRLSMLSCCACGTNLTASLVLYRNTADSWQSQWTWTESSPLRQRYSKQKTWTGLSGPSSRKRQTFRLYDQGPFDRKTQSPHSCTGPLVRIATFVHWCSEDVRRWRFCIRPSPRRETWMILFPSAFRIIHSFRRWTMSIFFPTTARER